MSRQFYSSGTPHVPIFQEMPCQSSRQQAADDIAMHVGETELAALVLEGQTFVVETEQVQHGGVEIMNMHWILDDAEADRQRSVRC